MVVAKNLSGLAAVGWKRLSIDMICQVSIITGCILSAISEDPMTDSMSLG